MNPFEYAKTPGPSKLGTALQKQANHSARTHRGASIDLTPRTRGGITIESAAQSAIARDRRAAMIKRGI